MGTLEAPDKLVIISYNHEDGRFYTLTSLFLVDEQTTQREADRLIRDITPRWESAYKAKFHVIAKKPWPMVQPVDFTRILEKLRLDNGERIGRLNHGGMDVHRFRMMRKLHPYSEEMIREFLI